MKLIQINIWSGMIYKPLLKFIKENKDADIFCFQEVTNGDALPDHVKNGNKNMLSALKRLLPEYNYYYSPFQKNEVGIATFISNNISIVKFEEAFIYRWYNAREGNDQRTLGRNFQLLEFVNNRQRYSIINFHGLWNGQGKYDTKDRIEQSKKLKKVLDMAKGKRVLSGDFNLMPGTKSLKILEKDMRNLITEFCIKDTRGKLYSKELRFADYILVSPKVNVLSFKVLPIEISDHLPLVLEFK